LRGAVRFDVEAPWVFRLHFVFIVRVTFYLAFHGVCLTARSVVLIFASERQFSSVIGHDLWSATMTDGMVTGLVYGSRVECDSAEEDEKGKRWEQSENDGVYDIAVRVPIFARTFL
jgi:hypothetical protein